MYKKYFLKFIILLCLSFAGSANATSFEKMMMPGKLSDAHKKFENNCTKCHESFSKSDQSKLCLSCHKKITTDMRKKKGFHGKNKQVKNRGCKSCHTEHKGRKANIIVLDTEIFNHTITDFPLKGQHQQTQCNNCHKLEKKYREALHDCFSCHKDDDSHKGKLGEKCYQCHNELRWNKIKFNHQKTDFPLRGKHKKASCESCHPDNRHKDTSSKCYSCHAIDDNHNGRYGTKCNSCHNEKKWSKSTFNHNKKTKFKLKGRHKTVTCDNCHTHKRGSIFKNKPKKTCLSCHQNDDIHNRQNGKKCQSCHSEKSWKKHNFNHDKDTKFKISGRHKKLSCNACHSGSNNNKIKKLKAACYSCHKMDDRHQGQLNKRCNNCHNSQGWNKNIKFNHDISIFPLLGQHAIIPCEECHLSQTFKDVSVKCISCHKNDDIHKTTLGSTCNQCHNPNGWKFWQFDHNTQTSFKLESSHKNLHCNACHQKSMQKHIIQSPTCSVCHAQDDVHYGDFGNHCEQCHTSDTFKQIKLLQ